MKYLHKFHYEFAEIHDRERLAFVSTGFAMRTAMRNFVVNLFKEFLLSSRSFKVKLRIFTQKYST